MIRLLNVTMATDVDNFVSPVLHSGFIGEGKQVSDFEQKIAEFIGVEPWQVVAVNSCTSALQLSLRLSGVEHGDQVISTPMTCSATNTAILAQGAKPIWCDVEPKTGNLSPDVLQQLLYRDSSDSIKALIAVHWGGRPCDVEEIDYTCHQEGIYFIEDAAQAFGAEVGDRFVGNNTSDFTCFSFQAIKTLTTGDGGAIVLRDPDMARRARLLRWFGLDRCGSTKLRCLQDPAEFGYKYQMNNIAAAIGLANIRFTRQVLDRLSDIATRYDDAFRGFNRIEVPHSLEYAKSSNWLYTVLADDQDAFIAFLETRGVESCRVHTRNDTKTIFAGSAAIRLPGVTYFDEHHVCIPIGSWLTDDDVSTVIKAVTDYENGA